jgi:signal-transduction protein with cAMP-binding, CBS, and nucleotidyltransferase domain
MAAFDFISESNLDKIMNDSTEKSYQSNERIMKENETAKNIFIILNGVGNEYCSGKISHLSIDKCAGKMVGELMLVTDNKHYLTSFISDSVCTVRIVPLKLMKALVNQNQDLESFIWKSCIFEFIRINI